MYNKNIRLKWYAVLFVALIATMFAACTAEYDETKVKDNHEFVTFEASRGMLMKTTLGDASEGSYAINWDNDSVYVFCDQAMTNYTYAEYVVTKSNSSSSVGKFTLEEKSSGIAWGSTATNYAFRSLYPAQYITGGRGESTLTISLPDTSVYHMSKDLRNISKRNLMWGRTTDESGNTSTTSYDGSNTPTITLNYKPIAAGLNVTYKNSIGSKIYVTRLTFQSVDNSQPLSGTFSFDLNTGTVTSNNNSEYTYNIKVQETTYDITTNKYGKKDTTEVLQKYIELDNGKSFSHNAFFPVLSNNSCVSGNIKVTIAYTSESNSSTELTKSVTLAGSSFKAGSITPVNLTISAGSSAKAYDLSSISTSNSVSME